MFDAEADADADAKRGVGSLSTYLSLHRRLDGGRKLTANIPNQSRN